MFKSALAAAALSALAAAAPAATYDIGTLPSAPTVYANVASVAGPSFSDSYTFVAPVVVGTASASSVTLDFGSTFNVDALVVKLFSAANVLLSTGSGAGESSTLFDVPLLAGASYRFEVTGLVGGSSGGLYSFVAAAAPVPEPESWLLLLAGLAAVGWVVLRRNSN